MSTIVERNCLSSILNLYSLCYLMFRLCRRNVTLCRLFIYVSRSSFTSWYCVFWSMFCGTFYCFITFHDVSSLHLLHCFRLGRSSNSVQISARHGVLRFFNTNNLWVDLVALKREFRRNDGALPLPVMKRIGEGMDGDGGFFTGKWCLVFGGKYVLWGSYHIDEHSPGVWQNYIKLCHVVFSWEDAVVFLWLGCCSTIEARASHDGGHLKHPETTLPAVTAGCNLRTSLRPFCSSSCQIFGQTP